MAQTMGPHFDLNARELQMFFDDARDAARGDAPAAMIEKHRRCAAASGLPLQTARSQRRTLAPCSATAPIGTMRSLEPLPTTRMMPNWTSISAQSSPTNSLTRIPVE